MKPKKEMRFYDQEFKKNAVKLYMDSDRSLSQVSAELVVPNATLAGWVQSYKTDKEEAFPGKGNFKNTYHYLLLKRKHKK